MFLAPDHYSSDPPLDTLDLGPRQTFHTHHSNTPNPEGLSDFADKIQKGRTICQKSQVKVCV